jgi:hypothetical protein
MKKLSLEIEALSVDSFETSGGQAPFGTVRGHSEGDDPSNPTPPVELDACTCLAGCLDPTNAYYCATAPATMVSCRYTHNASCWYQSNDC